jgi:tRNA dimethylallyltransferase
MITRETPDTGGVRPPLALIAGPTASGKSDRAVDLALALNERGRAAVVINADSAQVYADLAVLSARPADADMRGVPHRLYGTWDGAEACSAADWAARAKSEIAAAHCAGSVPILVGGTGLYIRTLLDGIAPVPAIDPAVRAAVRALPLGEARAALTSEDAEAAARIGPADSARIMRALEVVRSTGRPLKAWQSEMRGGIGGEVDLHAAILLPPRDALYRRCDARFAAMLEGGAVPEVGALLARGLPSELPIMRAIGVREITALLRGEATRDQTLDAGAQATRNYAKRQYTWFRHQSPPGWPRLEAESFNAASIFASLFHHLRLTG